MLKVSQFITDIKESPMTLVELNGVHSFSVGQRVVVGDTTHKAHANTNNGMRPYSLLSFWR